MIYIKQNIENPINYRKRVEIWYRGGHFKGGGADAFTD